MKCEHCKNKLELFANFDFPDNRGQRLSLTIWYCSICNEYDADIEVYTKEKNTT